MHRSGGRFHSIFVNGMHAMFAEYDVVRLIQTLSEGIVAGGSISAKDIPVGSIGTVVLVCTEPEHAYEVEFSNGDGDSYGVATVFGEEIRKIEKL